MLPAKYRKLLKFTTYSLHPIASSALKNNIAQCDKMCIIVYNR
jgi:hypothetical protein